MTNSFTLHGRLAQAAKDPAPSILCQPLNVIARPVRSAAGASPNESEDEDAVRVLSEHPAPSAPAPIADPQTESAVPLGDGPRSASAPAQTASQQQSPASDAAGTGGAAGPDPAQTASQQRSAVRGAGSEPAGSVPAQTAGQRQSPVDPGTGEKPAPAQPAQRVDSDEDADTWQFMTLPPPGARAQQLPARDAAQTRTPLQPPADQPQPSPHSTGEAAGAPQAGGTDPKPSSHEWEAELEPEEGAEGGRAAAAVIAAATIAAAGDGLRLLRQGSRHQHKHHLMAVASKWISLCNA